MSSTFVFVIIGCVCLMYMFYVYNYTTHGDIWQDISWEMEYDYLGEFDHDHVISEWGGYEFQRILSPKMALRISATLNVGGFFTSTL